MTEDLVVRPERSAEADAITDVTRRAFATAPHADGTEPSIVLALRRAGALTVSLVAEAAGRVVGHAAFSPVRVSDGSPDWYGLGPVSVLPERQRSGVGTALIERGLAELRSRGAAGCVVLGDPAYYGRFGFRSRADCVLEGVPPDVFQALPFREPCARGVVTYHAAFDGGAGEAP